MPDPAAEFASPAGRAAVPSPSDTSIGSGAEVGGFMTYDLTALGWDDASTAAYRRFDRSDAAPARVLRVDRGVCTVLAADGVGRASLAGTVLLGAVHDPCSLPCPGDWVVVRRWPDRRTTVEVVLPRRGALFRTTTDAAGGSHPRRCAVAANLDVVAVVEPVHPQPDVSRIARLLASVRASGARPVVVLSKCDMVADPAAVAGRLAGLFPDAAVSWVSVRSGAGLDALRGLAGPGRTLALLGGPGAGVSTLTAALAGATVLPAPGIRDAGGGDAGIRGPGGGRAGGRGAGGRGAGRRGAGGRVRPVAGSAVLVPVPGGGGAILDLPDGDPLDGDPLDGDQPSGGEADVSVADPPGLRDVGGTGFRDVGGTGAGSRPMRALVEVSATTASSGRGRPRR
jgi:putative ribosome biogenesis GTPase RsgA